MRTEYDIEQLAATLHSMMSQGGDLSNVSLFRHLVVVLAHGQPIAPERLARVFGRSTDEIVTILHTRPSIEWDESGNVVGAGLALNPTPHRFELNGRVLFTWCALDSLMFPGLLGQTVHVESPCASTGTPIRVTVTPDGVEHVEPAAAVVSVVTPEASPDIRRVFCDYVNFFRSPEGASTWLAEHPAATIVPVRDAYLLGKRLVELTDRSLAASS